MKMIQNKKQIKQYLLAWLLSATMLVSLFSTGSVSYATEATTAEATTAEQGTSEQSTEGQTTQTGTGNANNSNSNNGNTNTDPNGTLGKNSEVGLELTESITGKAGENVTIAFILKSNNVDTIKLKSVYPVIDNSFPFETSGDAYKIITTDNDVEKQKALQATFTVKARNDLAQGYHSVRFIGEYQKLAADGSLQDFYVIKTINIYFTDGSSIPEDSSEEDEDDSKKKEEEEDNSDSEDDGNVDDSYDDGGSYNDGGSESEAVAPKLIITGYETNPKKVMAGEIFTITIHIQNTSKTTNVCNGKFLVGNEAGSFTPTNGSNAVFVESIKAGETGDIVMEMKAGADLAQKNYNLVVKGDFDDGRGNNFTSSDSLIVPVYQKVDFNVTEISMSPSMLGVGEEGTLMFTINNLSNAGVNNVNVSLKNSPVTAEETYVGNIAGSSSAYATMIVTGTEESALGDTSIVQLTVVISYEDSEGTKETIEKAVSYSVGLDEFDDGMDVMDEYDDYDEYEDDEFYISPIGIVLIVLVVLGVIAGIIVFVVQRRKKRMAEILETEDGEDDLYDENF